MLLHTVRKEPAGWGTRNEVHAALASDCVCTNEEGSIDSNAGSPALRAHVSTAQPVTLLEAPPSQALEQAQKALKVVRMRACAEGDGPLYLSRVDLLPAAAERNGEEGQREDDVRWFVSEVEIGWPHLFLRADQTGMNAVAAAEGLIRHLDRC